MGNSASMSWTSQFNFLKETHDEAYKTIETAISLEEQEKPNEAVEKYKEGILIIDKALDIQITCPENPDLNWEQARSMITKMKKTRAEVLMRINCITSSPKFVSQEPPPSYDEATSSSTSSCGDVPRTYNDLAAALNDLHVELNNEPAEVIYTHDDVRLYFISSDGTVTQTLDAETLNIAVIQGSVGKPRTVFLQVGDWIYPLVPGVSPCYRTDYGAFILPNVYSEVPGSSIGIILPKDADESVYELLESILHGVISQVPFEIEPKVRPPSTYIEEPPSISNSISNGLINGAYYISQGLIKGAEKAGSFMSYSTPKIINSLTPAAEASAVPPTLSKSLQIASSATGTAAHFTGYVAEKVGFATQALGRFLAPHIQKQGTRLLTSGFNWSEGEASARVSGILTVAAGAVEGFATVYRGLETSASILGQNLSNNTVQIVQHKYGAPAGELATNTFSTMGNVITISRNSRMLTPKSFAKIAAKHTGKAMVEDARSTILQQRNSVLTITSSTSVLYPNLQQMQHVERSTSTTLNSTAKKEESKSLTK